MHQTKQLLQSPARFSFEPAIHIGVIVITVVFVGLLSFVVADSLISHAYSSRGTFVVRGPNVLIVAIYTNDDGVIDNPNLDPLDNGIDPGHDKPVAACHAEVDDAGRGQLWISNGYPNYTCQFWVVTRNTGSDVIQSSAPSITAPPGLTVLEVGKQPANTLIEPADIEIEGFTVHIETAAKERFTYRFRITKRFSVPTTGTIGFWHNRDSHDTCSQAEIEQKILFRTPSLRS